MRSRELTRQCVAWRNAQSGLAGTEAFTRTSACKVSSRAGGPASVFGKFFKECCPRNLDQPLEAVAHSPLESPIDILGISFLWLL